MYFLFFFSLVLSLFAFICERLGPCFCFPCLPFDPVLGKADQLGRDGGWRVCARKAAASWLGEGGGVTGNGPKRQSEQNHSRSLPVQPFSALLLQEEQMGSRLSLLLSMDLFRPPLAFPLFWSG